MLKKGDALGHALYDCFSGKETKEIFEIVQRNDGYFDISNNMHFYLSQYKDWPLHEKQALRYVRGQVLDIGCGAGRHALYLQKKGLKVMGIDISPLAVKVCVLRGLKHVKVARITQATRKWGMFDTIMMMDNNFGLFENCVRTRWLLKKFHSMTSCDGRIIAQTQDPHKTNNPWHLQYLERNRRHGHMPGQAKIRIRYLGHVSPWFNYLFVSKREMSRLLIDTGWHIQRFIDGNGKRYIAIIEKD